MTIDAARAGLDVEEVELDLSHRAPAAICSASPTAAGSSPTSCSPSGRRASNFRGLRLPLVGWVVGVAEPAVAPSPQSVSPTTSGAGRSGVPARTCARVRRPGSLKLVGDPALGRFSAPARSPARSSSGSPRTRSTSSTRGPAGRSRRSCRLARCWRAHRAGWPRPSSSLPTICARWRCSETRVRMRSGPC